MATFSDGEIAIAYLGEDKYAYLALYKDDGTILHNV